MVLLGKLVQQQLIPGAYGGAVCIKEGQYLKVIDVQGKQVCDFFAFNPDDPRQFLSGSHTRVSLLQTQAPFKTIVVGRPLLDNSRQPMLFVEEDTVGMHDWLMAPCDQARYSLDFGIANHRNCKTNALEALENTLHPTLSRVLVPLVDDISAEEKLKVAQKQFGIAREGLSDPQVLLADLLDSEDAITQMCALYVIGEGRMEGFSGKLQALQGHPDLAVQETARETLERFGTIEDSERGEPMLSTMDKMIHLKKIHIFSDLQVRELAAISSVTVERDYAKDEVVVREDEPGDTMFLIISGEVSVIRNLGEEHEKFIAKITEDDYFGEMALFEDKPRSATVKTTTDAKLLVLGKLEFEEIMREFPQISINICRVFSQRIRDLQEKFVS